jgi:hypothetical protein
MTLKVTFVINDLGGTMLDYFDMDLSEFTNRSAELGIDLDTIKKIEVV